MNPASRAPLLVFLLAALFDRAALAAPCDDPAGAAVGAVVVSGVDVATDEDVRIAIGVKPGDVVAAVSLARLEDAVLATGWFERASVVLTEGDANGCVLRVRLEEYGPVAELRFEGVTVLDEAALRAAAATKPGTPANLRTAERDAAAITARYLEGGFEAARVASIDIEDGMVTIRVVEGTIARVEVRGAQVTGRRRVRQVLGIEPGAVYSSKALVAGQAALYRTGLFSTVGFGVEPVSGEDARGEERLVLTVNVTEHRNPFSRTEVFAGQGTGADGEERGLSSVAVEARIRNAGGGNSLRLSADVLAPAPDGLAQSGFDEFYRARGRADFAFFRPEESAGGGLVGLEAERVAGRLREDLGLQLRADAPAITGAIELPVVQSSRILGLGGFAGTLGWRKVFTRPPNDAVLPGGPEEETKVFDGIAGRGEVGIDLREAGGLGLDSTQLRVRAGLEMHDGLEPFSFAAAHGRFLQRLAPGHHVELSGDATLLSGDVPFWRETALGGREGPPGFGREFAFARRHARGRIEYAASFPRELVGASTGVSAIVWGGANGAGGSDDAGSAFLELRLGPEFARLRAGIAVPVPERDREPWFYAGVVVATPY